MHGLAFNLFSRGMLTDYAKITSHFAARRCGARTLACRVGTRADAWLQCAEASRRVSTRHASAQRAPSAPRFGCEVIIAWALSVRSKGNKSRMKVIYVTILCAIRSTLAGQPSPKPPPNQ